MTKLKTRLYFFLTILIGINIGASIYTSEEDELASSSNRYDEHFNCVYCYKNGVNLPKSCAEATVHNNNSNGLYLLDLGDKDLLPFYVYCEHERSTEKAWTVIQRREDGSVNFKRNWFDYKHGFGDLYGEYWIGLERLHAMTNSRPHELWVFLMSYNGEKRSAKYKVFSVASKREDYKLTIGGYSGNATDAFSEQNNMKFSTFDNDHSLSKFNCARKYRSGWWFKDCYQRGCDLNGPFYTLSNKLTFNSGIRWLKWLNDESLMMSRMAIRPL